MAGRLWTLNEGLDLRGRVEGMLAIQGPWANRRYGGFLGARDVVLSAGSTTFPVSDIAVRIDNRGARLAPLRITLTPRLVAEVEGTLDRSAAPARYELTFSCGAVSIRDAERVSRTLGFRSLPGWSALGSATASFRVSGLARLSSPPALAGHAEVRDARIMIPGFTEPINVPRASLQVNGNDIVVDPLVAALGTFVFSGRLERQGGSHNPGHLTCTATVSIWRRGPPGLRCWGVANPYHCWNDCPGWARRVVNANSLPTCSLP